MDVTIESLTPEIPEQRVSLNLSVAEFAGLLGLHNESGGGSPEGVRGSIEKGLEEAEEELHPAWRAKIARVVEGRTPIYAYDRVDKVFAEDSAE